MDERAKTLHGPDRHLWGGRTVKQFYDRRAVLRRFGLLAILLSVGAPLRRTLGSTEGFINTDVLNLREGPGTGFAVITQMWQNEPVTILDGPNADGWYKVSYYGTIGWASGAYIGTRAGGVGGGGWEATAWVSTDYLNVRRRASTTARVLKVLTFGETVTVLGDPQAGFYPIAFNGGRAWVWAGFLSFEQPSPDTAERWIDVNRSTQMVSLMEGETVLASYWGAMGYDTSDDGFYSTAIGSFRVYGLHAPLSFSPYANAWFRHWVGFDPKRENGFHSYTMNRRGRVLPNGAGPTGGCVALAPVAAKQVYDFASIGMRVKVHR